ncbi:eukaryotic mitochondrial regulator protein-domain-containing protein [Biscogniauxia marginata]|nr:eukaryotic mitochondrial regulator protein-domain-containing protein [Biscogniauxia marginata]
MPPRISSSASSAISAVADLTASSTPASVNRCLVQQRQQQTASFSTTASRPRFTKARRLFRAWEKGPGSAYRKTTNTPKYIQPYGETAPNRDQPFPLNPLFKSHPVLDDRARELIWRKVIRNGEAVKAVSAELGVDIKRVAAIVRLKEVEKDWEAKGKKLAKPYAKAVLSMLPVKTFYSNQQNDPYEPINELHVHPYTMQQIFWPTSESRHFTRFDAARAFHKDMLPADRRVPHPELILMERELLQGLPPREASDRFKEAVMQSERLAAERQLKKAAKEEERTTRVNTDRFQFRFKEYNSEEVGARGKKRNVVGWRYGAPYYDRTKDHQIKIPTSVP